MSFKSLRELSKSLSHRKPLHHNPQKIQQQLTDNFYFNAHSQKFCVCSDCVCGRHLCKLQKGLRTKLGQSQYQENFRKIPRSHSQQLLPKHCESHAMGQGSVIRDSSYGRDFLGQKGQLNSKVIPQNQIKIQKGLISGITSYGHHFPGFKGCNQYVKPPPEIKVGGLPFYGDTTYNRNFRPSPTKLTQNLNINYDNLKPSTMVFLSNSTYDQCFQKPKPKDYPKRITSIQSQLQTAKGFPGMTTYANDFNAKDTCQCPAKLKLKMKFEKLPQTEMSKLKENGDFKSIAKDYHALSTSKLSVI